MSDKLLEMEGDKEEGRWGHAPRSDMGRGDGDGGGERINHERLEDALVGLGSPRGEADECGLGYQGREEVVSVGSDGVGEGGRASERVEWNVDTLLERDEGWDGLWVCMVSAQPPGIVKHSLR